MSLTLTVDLEDLARRDPIALEAWINYVRRMVSLARLDQANEPVDSAGRESVSAAQPPPAVPTTEAAGDPIIDPPAPDEPAIRRDGPDALPAVEQPAPANALAIILEAIDPHAPAAYSDLEILGTKQKPAQKPAPAASVFCNCPAPWLQSSRYMAGHPNKPGPNHHPERCPLYTTAPRPPAIRPEGCACPDSWIAGQKAEDFPPREGPHHLGNSCPMHRHRHVFPGSGEPGVTVGAQTGRCACGHEETRRPYDENGDPMRKAKKA